MFYTRNKFLSRKSLRMPHQLVKAYYSGLIKKETLPFATTWQPGAHDTKRNKSDRKRQVLFDLTYMQIPPPKKKEFMENRTNW